MHITPHCETIHQTGHHHLVTTFFFREIVSGRSAHASSNNDSKSQTNHKDYTRSYQWLTKQSTLLETPRGPYRLIWYSSATSCTREHKYDNHDKPYCHLNPIQYSLRAVLPYNPAWPGMVSISVGRIWYMLLLAGLRKRVFSILTEAAASATYTCMWLCYQLQYNQNRRILSQHVMTCCLSTLSNIENLKMQWLLTCHTSAIAPKWS